MTTSTIYANADAGVNFMDIDISNEFLAFENMHIGDDTQLDAGPTTLLSVPFQMIMDPIINTSIAGNVLPSDASRFDDSLECGETIVNQNDDKVKRPKPQLLQSVSKAIGYRNTFTAIAPAGKGHTSVNVVIKRTPRW